MKLENPDAKLIFAEALSLSVPNAREAYLDQACTGNQPLREEVESLLSAHAKAGDFLNQTYPLPASDFLIERTGTMIGRYKLLEKIGEGGFGVVYMAEQVEPVQRKVALKIIKAGMDTKEVVARFEAERQALALMNHPNIAKVLDAGATEAGRPYFVMELVRGIPITDYCDQKLLSTAERLELFIRVCHGVQHAHQKGIIHRDLKPSNVLVTLHDGEPVPKIIDFGVAKALGQKLTEKTLFTGFAQMLGTPAYMSPEQAELSGLDIDTRSDIYSLGVLLYELLTGVTPFDKETLARAALDEIRRMIRETEPLKPSTRLAQQLVAADESGLPSNAEARKPKSEQAISEASHRLLRIKERIRLVRGDLDWIVMQCLEKDRTRRYDTANGLLMDIERHLNSEPVTASPPSNLYRLGKLVRRNKLLFAASVAVLIVLLLGIGASTWQAARARRAERTARLTAESETKARQAAQSQHMKADEVVAKLALAMMSPRLDETPPRPSDTDSGIATSASTPHRAERQASLSVAIVMARREVGYWSGAMGEGLGRLFVTQLRRATNFAVAESVQLPLALPALAASKVTADDEVLRTQSREGTDYLLKTVVTRFGGGVVQIDWRIVNNLTREIRIGATGRIEGRQTETWTNYSSWRASAEDIRTEFLESPPGQALMKAISNIVEKVKTVGLTEVNARGREAPTIGVAKTESALAAPPWAPDLGRVFGERFVIELARLTNIQVLESFALDDVRAAIAPTSRGHWRGADYTFRSTVTRFGGAKSSPGQAAPSKSQSGLAGKRQIEVWIDWRIVDNATRVSAQHGTARATDEQLAEAKLDASDQQPDPYGSEDFFESALGKAAARAIEQIVERVKNLQLGPGARSINTK